MSKPHMYVHGCTVLVFFTVAHLARLKLCRLDSPLQTPPKLTSPMVIQHVQDHAHKKIHIQMVYHQGRNVFIRSTYCQQEVVILRGIVCSRIVVTEEIFSGTALS